MIASIPDIVDHLVGIAPGSPLDGIRRQRTQARENTETSFRVLFAPENPGGVSLAERHAVAAFVTGLHKEPAAAAAFYAAAQREQDAPLARAVAAELPAAAARGPYGHYPAGPLSREDQEGPGYRVSEAGRAALGPRLAAFLEHAHMLVLHPRDASAGALQSLLDAGFATTDIVTLSQLVAFLSFQIRVVAGLITLAAAMEAPAPARAAAGA